MPDEDDPCGAVMEQLGFALFLHGANGTLGIRGIRPEWLSRLWPGGTPAPGASPFLDNFLIDARECWKSGPDRRVESGPWIERDSDGAEVRLQATALTAGGRECLLLERLGDRYARTAAVLQRAREKAIVFEELDSAMQKKDILVHCLAEELSAALGNVVTSLRLIEMVENPPKTVQLLNLALRGTDEQREIMDRMMRLFVDDLSGLYGQSGAAPESAELRLVLKLAAENVAPHYSEKGVRLAIPTAFPGEVRVAAEASRFESVVSNLLRNALEKTPPGGEVSLEISDEADAVLLTVWHPESGTPDEPGAAPEGRLAPARRLSFETVVRLRFCQIAVEGWHGGMGSLPGGSGVSRTWVRVPKPGATT